MGLFPPFVRYFRVDGGARDCFVPEPVLHVGKVQASIHQVDGDAVPEDMDVLFFGRETGLFCV